ncbi:MAG TPA: ferritin [Candidatus Goldiibacteriota bacterium]|nr:ferritin [Candidatus Goldiibacteriota bacterium]
MIGKRMEEGLNKQVNAEFYSSFLYLAMSADFESKNLKGFAHWMKAQAAEEYDHAMRIYKHIVERGGKVKLTAIDGPKSEWKNALEAFEDAYAHEQKVTGMIYKLVEMAKDEKDYAAESMLKWFVDEQVEEEAQTLEVVEQLKMIGDSKGSLFQIDHKLAKRKED